MVKKAQSSARFFCDACGYESVKWMGRCPGCGAFDSLVRALPEPRDAGSPGAPAELLALADVASTDSVRVGSGWSEVDRVLGGGIIPGSLILLGGEPGIGKSTLLLASAAKIAASGKTCVYLSAEEAAAQVRIRADRICGGNIPPTLKIIETSDLTSALDRLAREPVDVLMVDSIQAVHLPEYRSVSGSVLQIRECVLKLMAFARRAGGPAIWLVGHITKSGEVAGPKLLEHMVDTVLSFDGDPRLGLRFLRSQKNRFGSTAEIGVFDMRTEGLVEQTDPSALFRGGLREPMPGVASAALMEGSRVFLVEIQALVTPSHLAVPRRVASGVDARRLQSLLAVLDTRASVRLGAMDVFVSTVGGFIAREPASDLAVALAVASACRQKPLPHDLALFGEVSLSGELRAVPSADRRLSEARRVGFKRALCPKSPLEPSASRHLDIVEPDSIVAAVKEYL